jgi:hypothetical protein
MIRTGSITLRKELKCTGTWRTWTHPVRGGHVGAPAHPPSPLLVLSTSRHTLVQVVRRSNNVREQSVRVPHELPGARGLIPHDRQQGSYRRAVQDVHLGTCACLPCCRRCRPGPVTVCAAEGIDSGGGAGCTRAVGPGWWCSYGGGRGDSSTSTCLASTQNTGASMHDVGMQH